MEAEKGVGSCCAGGANNLSGGGEVFRERPGGGVPMSETFCFLLILCLTILAIFSNKCFAYI